MKQPTKVFKEVKKKTDKITQIQSQFQGLNIKGDGDNSDEETVGQRSLHENLIYQYLNRTKLEQVLLTGLKSAISGDTIPKNPWCELSRTLGLSNLKIAIFDNFEQLVKNFRKTPVGASGPYKICSIAYGYKEKIRQLNEDNIYEDVTSEKTFNVYGYEQNLEYIFLPNLKETYNAILTIIPEFTKQLSNCTLQVINSLSGGYILKSQLIQYPNAHPKDLEIFCECFITASSYDIGIVAFANFVYEDCIAIQNKKDIHLLKEFVIYSFDDISKKSVKSGWKMKTIRHNKNKFIQDIIANTKERNSMYWKGYCRVKLFENENLSETMDDINGVNRLLSKDDVNHPDSIPYQYIETYKNYNLHVKIATEQKSYAHQPLASLFKGVFFDLQQAQRYASYFYKEDENFLKIVPFQSYIRYQLQLVQKKWVEQNIGACSWELLYLAFYIESAEMRRNLIDSIIQIVSSDYSALISCAKYNKTLRQLMHYYAENTVDQVIPIINTTYKVFKENMIVIYGKSSGADIIRYRDFIFRLFREMEDNQGGFIVEEKSSMILKVIHKIIKFMGQGNLQKLGVVTKNLPQFINDALTKNDLLSDDEDYITFQQFEELKVPKKMMHVSLEVRDQKKKMENKKIENKSPKEKSLKNDQDIEDNIILEFLNEYDLFDNLYFILRDIFFGKQIPNALPSAQYRVETMGLKYQLFEITREEVREQMCNKLSDKLLIDIKDPSKRFYGYLNEEMSELNMKPIYALEEVIYYTSVFEISGLKMFLDSLNWTKAIKKGLPQAFQIQPIMSISTYNLFQHSTVLGRTYCEWNINWDWVLKGPSYQHAQQIFVDTILKYVCWLELSTDVIMMGFFLKKNPRHAFITIDEILEAQDLVKIKETLLQSFTQNSRVYFKIIFKVESRFKTVNYLINLHFIDPVDQVPQNLLVTELPDTYLKIFFEKSDFLLWNKIYPYNKNQALKLIAIEQKDLFNQGFLNNTIKLELIKDYITETEEFFLTMSRVLFSYSETFYNFCKLNIYIKAREAETFYFLFLYLAKQVGVGSKTQKKFTIADIRPFFEEYDKALMNDLLAYDNTYFDSLGAAIMNHISSVKQAFLGSPNYKSYQNSMFKLSEMCLVVSDSVILTFRQLLLEEYGQNLLWVAK